MVEDSSERPLTEGEITKTKAKRPGANLLCQQAGIQSVDKQKKPIGIKIDKAGPTFKNIKQILDKPSEERTSIEKILAEAYFWLNPSDTKDYPQLEVGPYETNILGLTKLYQRLEGVIDNWLSQDSSSVDKRQSLAEALRESPLLKEMVLSTEKIKLLSKLSGLDSQLKVTLTTLRSFYQQTMVPLLVGDSEKQEKLVSKWGQEAKELLQQPKGKRQETYQQKAWRLLVEQSRDVARKTKKLPATRYHGLIKAGVKTKLPARFSVDILRLAETVNYVRLVEILEKKGINFLQTRQQVAKLLQNIPGRGQSKTKLSLEEEKWLFGLNELLAPIANTVKELFPHDTVNLLSQILDQEQAVCAGKAMALTKLYRSLGLDARYTGVAQDVSSDSVAHAICSINLPKGLVMQVDANYSQRWRQKSSRDGVSEYRLLASILIPTNQSVKSLSDFLVKGDGSRVVIGQKGQWRLYRSLTPAHQISSQYLPEYQFSRYNLANLLKSYPDLFTNSEFGKTEDDVHRTAARFYQKELELNPKVVGNRNNLAILLKDYPSLFANSEFGKTEDDVYQFAEHLYREEERLFPNQASGVAVKLNRAMFYLDHLDCFVIPSRNKKDLLAEIEGLVNQFLARADSVGLGQYRNLAEKQLKRVKKKRQRLKLDKGWRQRLKKLRSF